MVLYPICVNTSWGKECDYLSCFFFLTIDIPFGFGEMGKKHPPESSEDKSISVCRNFRALQVLEDRLLHLLKGKGVTVPL